MRKVALAGGLLYLLTLAASIPQLKLFAHITDDPEGYVMGHGSNTPVLWGTWFEIITALAWDQVSAAGFVLGLPIAAWEFSLGIWLTVKGFRPAALAALAGQATTRAAASVA